MTALAFGCQVGSGAPRTTGSAPRAELVLIELQPEDPSPGGQFVRVENLTARTLDLGCWSLSSAATRRKLFVQRRLRVPAHRVADLTPSQGWLGVSDRVTLRDRAGRVVDRSPRLRDTAFDDQVWFRKPGGRWHFGRSRAATKTINGNLVSARPRGC